MTNESDITPIAEEAAEGEVKEIFEEIKSVLNVPEVPVIYRIMAHIPLYLETSWQRVRFALMNDGVLDKKTKCLVSLAISSSNNNKHMILENTARSKAMGTTDTEIAELMAVVDVTNGLNKVLKAAQVEPGTQRNCRNSLQVTSGGIFPSRNLRNGRIRFETATHRAAASRDMATIPCLRVSEADGQVKEFYEDIMRTYDFDEPREGYCITCRLGAV